MTAVQCRSQAVTLVCPVLESCTRIVMQEEGYKDNDITTTTTILWPIQRWCSVCLCLTFVTFFR